jgi:hypothetical protein
MHFPLYQKEGRNVSAITYGPARITWQKLLIFFANLGKAVSQNEKSSGTYWQQGLTRWMPTKRRGGGGWSHWVKFKLRYGLETIWNTLPVSNFGH